MKLIFEEPQLATSELNYKDINNVNGQNLGLKINGAYKRHKQRQENNILRNGKLPIWYDDERALPNGILRSALFRAIQPGARRYIDGEIIAAVKGVEIKYTGQSLDQGITDCP